MGVKVFGARDKRRAENMESRAVRLVFRGGGAGGKEDLKCKLGPEA